MVQLDDGADVTEEYDVTTEETAPGQVELGEGAIHVYVPGEAAQVEKRTGKVSGKTVEETVKEGSDNVYLKYNANTNGEKVIALTFDDGPWPTTSELLDVLKENDAVATFFTHRRADLRQDRLRGHDQAHGSRRPPDRHPLLRPCGHRRRQRRGHDAPKA